MDRNYADTCKYGFVLESLSARRAWIEIVESGEMVKQFDVALRKESVDRNFKAFLHDSSCISSLSARRAWIEIPHR